MPSATLMRYWTNNVDEDRIYFAVNQLYERVFKFSDLPPVAVSADFYACSRLSNDGPANQLMCPFDNYSAEHASVFSYYKACTVKATMNQKPRMQAPTRPNDNTAAAQYPPAYIVGVYVSQADRIADPSPTYLGTRKFYSYDGQSVNPAPQFKKIYPEVIKAQVIDTIRACQGQLGQSIASLRDAEATNPQAGSQIVNSPRFYKEASLCMLSKIFKSVQSHCLSFMTTPSLTAISVQANSVQLFGSAAMVFNSIGPIVDGGNLVLPFFEFAQTNEISPWYSMDRDPSGPGPSTSSLYATTLYWNSVNSTNDEYSVHFADQVVNNAWIAGYSAILGARRVPFYALLACQRYQKMLQSFSLGSGTWLNMDPPTLGGSSMITFTKFVRNTAELTPLPVYDENAAPNDTPFPIRYLLNVERLLYMNFLFGLPFSESMIAVHSLDIEDDDSEELNEFPYSQPLNLIPGSDNPWTLLNSEIANSNGVFQKSYAATEAVQHGEVKTILGVPVIPVNNGNDCFFSAIMNSVSAVADAVSTGASFLAGDASFSDVVDSTVGVVSSFGKSSTAQTVADGIYDSSSRIFYQGSPNLTNAMYKKHEKESSMFKKSDHVSRKSERKAPPSISASSTSRRSSRSSSKTEAAKNSAQAKKAPVQKKSVSAPPKSSGPKNTSKRSTAPKTSPPKVQKNVQAKKPSQAKSSVYPKPKNAKPRRPQSTIDHQTQSTPQPPISRPKSSSRQNPPNGWSIFSGSG